MNNVSIKNFLILIVLLGGTQPLVAGTADFVFTVNTGLNAGADATFTIPTYGTGYKYNVDCDNDGNFEATAQTSSYVCDYTAMGHDKYDILIQDAIGDGTGFPRVRFNDFGEANEVIELINWGSGVWDSMEAAFEDAANMVVTASDVPKFSVGTSLRNMFRRAALANPDTKNWNTTNVINMRSMFNRAFMADPDTRNWDTANVTDMRFMFILAETADPDTSGWDTVKVNNMASMFSGATIANPDTSDWNTSNVTDMSFMFSGASVADPDTSNWNIANVTTMQFMFNNTTLPTVSYDDLLTNFSAQTVLPGVEFSGGEAKYCASAARDNLINNHGWSISDDGLDPECSESSDDFMILVDTALAGSTGANAFEIPTNGIGYNYNVDCDADNPQTNTATAQTGNYTCQYASSGIYTIRISDNSGNGTGFPRIFFNDVGDKDKVVDLIQWGTGQWASMQGAFRGTSNMSVTAIDVPNLSQVESLSFMFSKTFLANPDTSDWNTSNVTDMSWMFHNTGLADPNTGGWDTANVRNMNRMFLYASQANPDTSGWDTANVTNMGSMFQSANMANPDTSSWDISAVTTMHQIFHFITLPTASYDALLENFSSQNVQPGVTFSGGYSKYCAAAARNNLLNSNGWIMTDGGLDPACDDVIFRNSFDVPVETFLATHNWFSYDFALLENIKIDSYPELFAVGVDADDKAVIHFHVRKIDQQLQLRISDLDEVNFVEDTWVKNQWQNIKHTELVEFIW